MDVLKRKIADLENLAINIEASGIRLLQESPRYADYENGKNHWGELPDQLKPVQRDAIRKYQRWYTSAHQLIKEYIPEKEEEFVSCYEDKHTSLGVIDMLQLRDAWWIEVYRPITKLFLDYFEVQRSILLSVPDVAEIKELNLRKIITADVARTEIEEAEVLLMNKHDRAAGAIAGIALELHLKTLCNLHRVAYAPKDTIDPLATALYKAGKLDVTELKHIQYLGSIRNK